MILLLDSICFNVICSCPQGSVFYSDSVRMSRELLRGFKKKKVQTINFVFTTLDNRFLFYFPGNLVLDCIYLNSKRCLVLDVLDRARY